MARVRVTQGPAPAATETPSAPKASAAERTLTLPGVEPTKATEAPPVGLPVQSDDLGVKYVTCTCGGSRPSIGTLAQNGGRCTACGRGIYAVMAPSTPTAPPAAVVNEETAEPDIEREAIQAEEPIDPVVRAAERAADQDRKNVTQKSEGLGASFFGNGTEKSPAPAPPPAPVDPVREAVRAEGEAIVSQARAQLPKLVPAHLPTIAAFGGEDVGEEITATSGEEMYGKQGSFSSYRVGPLSLKTTVRPGETKLDAYRRLRADLAMMMAEERVAKRDEFVANFPKAF
jgi:hypothetical protein